MSTQPTGTPLNEQPRATMGFPGDIIPFQTIITKELTWLQKHEKMILAVIAGLALWFAISKVDTLIIHHDQAATEQAKIVAQADAAKTAAATAQAAQDRAAYEALEAKAQALQAQLLQQNAALVSALTKQQKTDASLPPSELANRWSALVPQVKPTVTPTGISVDTPSAVATVQQLEKVPVLTKELDNETQIVTVKDGLLAAANKTATDATAVIASMKVQAVADAKVCTETIATVKAEARKGKRTWFYVGLVTGWLGRGIAIAKGL